MPQSSHATWHAPSGAPAVSRTQTLDAVRTEKLNCCKREPTSGSAGRELLFELKLSRLEQFEAKQKLRCLMEQMHTQLKGALPCSPQLACETMAGELALGNICGYFQHARTQSGIYRGQCARCVVLIGSSRHGQPLTQKLGIKLENRSTTKKTAVRGGDILTWIVKKKMCSGLVPGASTRTVTGHLKVSSRKLGM